MSAPNNPLKRTADELEEAWVADEDRFVLQQTKKKAAIRIKANRPQTIDWLAIVVIVIDPEHNKLDDEIDLAELEVKDPKEVIYAQDEKGLDGLVKEIETFITLETSRSNQQYWKTMKEACEDRKEAIKPTKTTYRDINNVADKIDAIFAKKDYDGLVELEGRVKKKIASGDIMDPDFWNGILERMKGAQCKAKLKQISDKLLQARGGTVANATQTQTSNGSASQTGALSRFIKEGGAAYEHPKKGLASTASVQPAAKKARVEESEVSSAATDALLKRERARGMAEGEEMFAAEAPVSVNKSQASWATEYRPRKPKYFNRVHMGYEWNKYNQTHYDHDNPPPKIVQGYKFNIFYPDLIDSMKTPDFKVERENGRLRGQSNAPAGEADTCIIRFIGGPPYEDIAFRIVDKEWDYSAKSERGYKSVFDKVEYFRGCQSAT